MKQQPGTFNDQTVSTGKSTDLSAKSAKQLDEKFQSSQHVESYLEFLKVLQVQNRERLRQAYREAYGEPTRPDRPSDAYPTPASSPATTMINTDPADPRAITASTHEEERSLAGNRCKQQ
jgi:hypothetical protein